MSERDDLTEQAHHVPAMHPDYKAMAAKLDALPTGEGVTNEPAE